VKDFVAGEDVLGALAQQRQQARLGRRQRDALAAAAVQCARLGDEGPVPEVTPASLGMVPADERAQACEQLVEVERLDEVVVGAAVEAVDPVRDGAESRQQQHRRGEAGGAHRLHDLHPVEPRQTPVDDQDIEALRQHALPCGETVAEVRDVVDLGEHLDGHARDRRVVFHVEQSRPCTVAGHRVSDLHRHHSPTSAPRIRQERITRGDEGGPQLGTRREARQVHPSSCCACATRARTVWRWMPSARAASSMRASWVSQVRTVSTSAVPWASSCARSGRSRASARARAAGSRGSTARRRHPRSARRCRSRRCAAR
jgi:hypothetical protein